ncbi:MAG: glycosyltransferase, partial [Bacteroidales bacterium]|nr:glycosyltransferase [Bacteroidales bacterium]
EAMPEADPVKGDYFLYFGRLSREKGLLTLIAAAKIAGVNLIIAGSGPQEGELRRQENGDRRPEEEGRTETGRRRETGDRRTEESSNIKFVGYQSGEHLSNLIRGCSFVVVPSEWYENNPMSVVESFALGKPVIAARIGGIPELVNGHTGFLFESGNVDDLAGTLNQAMAIQEVEYQDMSEKCLTFAYENFSRTKHLDNLMEVYMQAIG